MAATGKSKLQSTKSASFAKGGSTKMFGKQTVATQVPGQSSSMKAGGGGRTFPKGGKTHMFGKQHVATQVPGQTASMKGGK